MNLWIKSSCIYQTNFGSIPVLFLRWMSMAFLLPLFYVNIYDIYKYIIFRNLGLSIGKESIITLLHTNTRVSNWKQNTLYCSNASTWLWLCCQRRRFLAQRKEREKGLGNDRYLFLDIISEASLLCTDRSRRPSLKRLDQSRREVFRRVFLFRLLQDACFPLFIYAYMYIYIYTY